MVSVEVYLRGSKIIVRASWKIESVAASENYDTLADPTTVVFSARLGSAAKTDYTYPSAEVTKVSVGIYELAFIPAVGRWYVHAQGTGTAYGAGRVTFQIDESEALAA